MQTVDDVDTGPLPAVGRHPAPLRDRLLPRSILGLTVLILAASLGAAFSGTVLYAYYDYRLNKAETASNNFKNNFSGEFKKAQDEIKRLREDAKSQVRKELEPLQKIAAEGNTLQSLLKKVAPSVWFVHTLDEAGQPSVGSAFTVAADAEKTYLVTSFATVRAATKRPGPPLKVRQGSDEFDVTLWTWQEDHDLALLVLDRGNLPKLDWAGNPPAQIGDRIFAVSGLGSSGGSITQGFVADVFNGGVQTDAPVGPSFQGGPLLNDKGEVVAVASRAYQPLGFATDGVYFGVPIRTTCERVLKCPSGSDVGAGQKTG
jgi:S1-C subfamily serine protease